MRSARIVTVCLVVAAAMLSDAAVSLASCLSAATEATLVAPYATGIDEILLDGVIWLEWDDASEYELAIGDYRTEVLVKHDSEYFYVAMVVHTAHLFPAGFEAFVFLDNGDNQSYSTGDDMLVARAEDGTLVEADYYYRATYDFCLDTEVGGTIDAHGVGRYSDAAGYYVFEFRRKIASGDAKDIQLAVGTPFSATYGWASY